MEQKYKITLLYFTNCENQGIIVFLIWAYEKKRVRKRKFGFITLILVLAITVFATIKMSEHINAIQQEKLRLEEEARIA